MARSAKHLPKYAPQTWAYYSPDATDPNRLTNAELVKVIRKAAKAANQRLRALEKSDVINTAKTGAYKYREKLSRVSTNGPKRVPTGQRSSTNICSCANL